MKFEKKLIILSGDSFAKGTLTLERNAYGMFATFSVYNLPDLNDGEYAAGIKNNTHIFNRKLGNLGRILLRFKIEDTDLSDVHCVIYDSEKETPLLYGTNSQNKLWHGNMMDGFKEKKSAKPALSPENISDETNLPAYAKKEPSDINDFFLDIFPRSDSRYMDNAVAAVNYYPGDMNIEVSYSDRKGIETPVNPLDKIVSEKIAEKKQKEQARVNNKTPENAEQNEETAATKAPWEFQREYIQKDTKSYILNKDSENFRDTGEKVFEEQIISDTVVNEEQSAQRAEEKESESQFISDTVENEERPKADNEPMFYQTFADEGVPMGTNEICEEDNDEFCVFDNAGYVVGKEIAKNAAQEKFYDEKTTDAQIKSFKRPSLFGAAKIPVKPQNFQKSGARINSERNKDVAATIPPLSQFSAENAVKNIVTKMIFYEQVKDQLDDLFATNPKFELLEKMMPDTKWIKVDYDNNGKYYVVGLIGANPDYLCYGVPARYTPQPPQDLSGYCQWLPVDHSKPEGDGFWLMFQDAISGESIKDLI